MNAHFFFILIRRQPTSTLFPYTTLFRSKKNAVMVKRRGKFVKNFSQLPFIVPRMLIVNAKTGTSSIQEETSAIDRKSTRLNSSHRTISYAVFCLKKKKTHNLDKLPRHNL